MPDPIRLVLVDDHPLVRAGLQVLLAPLAGVAVVAACATAAEAHAAVAEHRPDVVLLDLNLPDQPGADVCRQLTSTYPGLKVLALTTLSEPSYVRRLMQHGAAGYLLKNASPEELAEAIARVVAGKKYFSDEVQQLLLQAGPAPPTLPLLTRREQEVLRHLAAGRTSQQIADLLFLSPLTIETHRRNLLTKLDVNNTAALIKLAAEHGLA